MQNEFLPVTREEMLARGWDQPDFVVVSGDAYVDHPSFGHAIISRVLEDAGYRVCMLNQPDFHNALDFKRFGRPKYAFLVAAGNIDSMVNHYTAAKRPRAEDVYSPGGRPGLRPDRATIVYCNRIREAFGRDRVPIVIGGVEASLRRFAHYDYWEGSVRRSILVDSGADLLSYGMAEKQTVEIAARFANGEPLTGIAGTCYLADEAPQGAILLPAYDECRNDRIAYLKAFKIQYEEQDPVRGRMLAQPHEKKVLVAEKPMMPLSRAEMDCVYNLFYMRTWHPQYEAAGGVPALAEVEFSITATRGCFGACSFCALTFHQGRIVQSRSNKSILQEATQLTRQPGFKGYIHDVGGPTANFRSPACEKQLKLGACKDRQCLAPEPCKHLIVDHKETVSLLRDMRQLPGIKKVFIRSGLRFDYIQLDKDDTFLRELCQNHISGQLKVAPEHVSRNVLKLMGKPGCSVFNAFRDRYKKVNEEQGKQQYLVPYFISSHPGSDLNAAIELAEYLRDIGHQPEQVQDFIPTPGTLSTAMFYTGLNPLTFERVYVPRDPQEKAMQRALLQYKNPKNHDLVRRALRIAGRQDLIGFGGRCLVPPAHGAQPAGNAAARKQPAGKPSTGKPARDAQQRKGGGQRPGTQAAGGKPGARSGKPVQNKTQRPKGQGGRKG